VEVADEPVEVECAADGTLTVETQLFHDVHPWLGLRVDGALAGETPAFVTAWGERRPMLRVADGDGSAWWVHESGWDAERVRHFSELHRTIGRFEFAIGNRSLFVENVASGAGRAQLEEYLKDFQGDLVWLAMGFGGGTASGGAPAAGIELGVALEDFAFSARRVLSPYPPRDRCGGTDCSSAPERSDFPAARPTARGAAPRRTRGGSHSGHRRESLPPPYGSVL
jgi:hypothetical protein